MEVSMKDKNKGFTLIELLNTVAIIIIIFLVFFRGIFVDPNIAKRSLEIQGYKNVQVTNKAVFFIEFRGCGDDDASKISLSAKNPANQDVDIDVCVGWPFKGATIRTE